jgi:hypothetical protein
MYATLYAKIDAILAKISIPERFAYPIGPAKISKYPALIYFPRKEDNQFHTTGENIKMYEFVLYVVVGTANKDKNDIFKTVLPNMVDAIIAQFDEDWGDTIDGHRVSFLINSGDWSMTTDGSEAIVELNLRIKVLTNN